MKDLLILQIGGEGIKKLTDSATAFDTLKINLSALGLSEIALPSAHPWVDQNANSLALVSQLVINDNALFTHAKAAP